ncbi:hypothetical protein GCM10010435_15160 [Winogradskya consettensis]|uniref:Lipoprotein n=1 Tax=Winogradskya consettensis TaxID=113560 RepID=A0A919SDX4_9ACTN|nr:hypothetical protein [Actinoplanes consettensis]GIM69258.1 hypothetical protein Aco04nite_14440 [Actinoplanes consettensis]
MRNRRPVIAGLALVAALGTASLGLAGCGPESATSTGSTGTSVTGKEAAAEQLTPELDLAAAAKKLSTDTMKIDMDMSGAMSMTGVADGRTGDAETTINMGALSSDSKMVMRKIGNDIYMKIDGNLGKTLGADSSKPWMHIDATKLGEGNSFNFNSKEDPAGTKALLDAVTQVERVGDTGFKGTLDLTKSPRYSKGMEALGDKATKLPFTATKDSEGRLTELTGDMSSLGSGAGKMTTKYHDFGTKVSVEAPSAAQVQEMPSSLSGILNA